MEALKFIFVSSLLIVSMVSAMKLGDRPTMEEIRKFPQRGGHPIDVVEDIAEDSAFLSCILDDKNGNVLKGIKKSVGRGGGVMEEVFGKWLNGRGKEPVTWGTIINCLENARLNVLAGDIKKQMEGSNATPQTPTNTEKPRFSKEEETKLVHDNIPDRSPKKSTEEYQLLDKFSKEVKIILHTLNDNEFNAATTYISAPVVEGGSFTKATVFQRIGTVLGMFAEKEVALVQTEQGRKIQGDIERAIKLFPNAVYIIGIGVAYAMNEQKCKLADVLISNKINDLENFKFGADGEIEDRGQAINIISSLLRIFGKNVDHHEPLLVSDQRNFTAFAGNLACSPLLINNLEVKGKIERAVPTAIGGEMEGGELLKFIGRGSVKGIMIIKGVADYGDGRKSKEWQFTAAMAAFKYAESKLSYVTELEDGKDEL